MQMLKRKGFWIVLALLALCGGVGYRLTKTAEYLARFGSTQERIALCRTIPTFGAGRQEALLKRLLADPVEDVRLAAITATERGTESSTLDDLLESLLAAPNATAAER